MAIIPNNKVQKFILSLERQTITRVLKDIDLLEEFGYSLGMPQSKKISNNLWELRVRGVQEIRIFYAFYKGDYHLLHGFIKKSQKTPIKEIELALARKRSLTQI